MNIKALAFDTGGTVLDWHGGLVAAMSVVGEAHRLTPDWHEVVNDWRWRTMKGIVGHPRCCPLRSWSTSRDATPSPGTLSSPAK